MTRLLNGSELASYIKERQAKQVRNLRQEHGIIPKLVIIATDPTHASRLYMSMKQRYGEDILIETEIIETTMGEIAETIKRCNADSTTHGIIVQLPLSDQSQTDDILEQIAPQKDVDGLGSRAKYTSATAVGIDWLLNGYGIELAAKKIVIVGNGRLVGAPLFRLWSQAYSDIAVVDDTTQDLRASLQNADVIVTATGVPRLIQSDMLKQKAIVVDAGTASENGVVVGDVDPAVRETRDDLTITPEKGGVGPMTVAALFDAVIHAARSTIKK